MKINKLLVSALAGIISLSVTFGTQAATRDEIAAIKVSKSGNFNYWNKDSKAKQELINYIKDVTNKKSSNYIPVEDRIAVFDLDGTLICETAPSYFEWMLYLNRTLYDPNYTPSKADREYARTVEDAIKKGNALDMLSEAKSQGSVFAGMSYAEYEKYVQRFMETSVEGFSYLKWGEAFYLPMVEVIKYLQLNEFTVYIVSGSDREAVRILACDVLKIKPNHVIGTDVEILSTNQGNKNGLNYIYGKNENLIRGQFIMKNLNMNKVALIAQEIGKQPVLAFGNSSTDSSMMNYAINGNKYKSLSFMVLCDDLEREFGSTAKAAKCEKIAEDNGYISISMKNEFKTIYGDNVKREK